MSGFTSCTKETRNAKGFRNHFADHRCLFARVIPGKSDIWTHGAVVDAAYPDDGSTFYAEGSFYLVPATTDGHKVSISGPSGQYDMVYLMRVTIDNNQADHDDGQGRITVQNNYWERPADGSGSLFGEVFLGPGQHVVRTTSTISASRAPNGQTKSSTAPIIENTFTIIQAG